MRQDGHAVDGVQYGGECKEHVAPIVKKVFANTVGEAMHSPEAGQGTVRLVFPLTDQEQDGLNVHNKRGMISLPSHYHYLLHYII